jgi:hypothetical protein
MDDHHLVTELLGRVPQSEFEVVVRDGQGEPVVLRNAPFLHDGTPMPTRYWLAGREATLLVSRLEADGGVRRHHEARRDRDSAKRPQRELDNFRFGQRAVQRDDQRRHADQQVEAECGAKACDGAEQAIQRPADILCSAPAGDLTDQHGREDQQDGYSVQRQPRRKVGHSHPRQLVQQFWNGLAGRGQ